MFLNSYRKAMSLAVCLFGLGLCMIVQPYEVPGAVRYRLTRDPMVLLEALITINNSEMDAQVFFEQISDTVWEFDIYILPGNPTGNNDFVGDSPWTGLIDYNTSYEYVDIGPWSGSG